MKSINTFARLFALLLLCTSTVITAQQETTEEQAITNTIEDYFYGYIYRDKDKLLAAFDTANGAMKAPHKESDGREAYVNIPFSELVDRWSSKDKLPKASLDNSELKILSMDVVDGQMSTAKIRMKVDKTTYIDMLSLQQLNGEWKITNKIFVVEE